MAARLWYDGMFYIQRFLSVWFAQSCVPEQGGYSNFRFTQYGGVRTTS